MFWLAAASLPVGAQSDPPGDAWATNGVRYPDLVDVTRIETNHFVSLRTDFLAGHLKVSCSPNQIAFEPEAASARLFTSFGEPGHWPARDWRSQPMTTLRGVWEASVLIADVDTPFLYFLVTDGATGPRISPMRLFRPREAGMDLPTRFYWPFLEGFEDGLESWRLYPKRTNDIALRIDSLAKNGRAALLITVPGRQRAVAVATTRVRGGELVRESASGLSFWLRTRSGEAQARFSLRANAYTTDEIAATWPETKKIHDRWERVELSFGDIPALPLGPVDLFILEFSAEQPREILVDDLRLLTRWSFDLE